VVSLWFIVALCIMRLVNPPADRMRQIYLIEATSDVDSHQNLARDRGD
jgi:hypothetical protein